MLKFSTEKMPAFFRIMGPELFFEAEAASTENILQGLSEDIELDAELEELLASK